MTEGLHARLLCRVRGIRASPIDGQQQCSRKSSLLEVNYLDIKYGWTLSPTLHDFDKLPGVIVQSARSSCHEQRLQRLNMEQTMFTVGPNYEQLRIL